MSENTQKLRGVNLGGWLVLEKWITPSLFEGTNAEDEFHLHNTQNSDKIKSHYDNFITEGDFKFLSEHKINAIRIPVGYWIFGDFPPFPKTIDYLDLAFKYTEKYNLKVLIDLHAAPGSQNGYDHSGVIGEANWHKNPEYVSQTLNVLDRLSARYCEHKNLFGIGLLNEPHRDIPIKFLENFYIQGYEVVRKHCDEKVAVVISDSFRPLKFLKVMKNPKYKGVLIDTHLYQCFYEGDKKPSIEKILANTNKEWRKTISKVQKNKPVLCGEWSLGIDPLSLSHLSPENQISAITEFGRTQVDVFENTAGWFFWTYKTESPGGWNFRTSLEDGTLIF